MDESTDGHGEALMRIEELSSA